MKKQIVVLLLIIPFVLLSCGKSLKMDVNDMLEYSGTDRIPTQLDYPEDGAVVLYEKQFNKLFLDSDWEVNVEESYHRAVLYFNDKAEDEATQSIRLNPEIELLDFKARTIKPNGEIIELTKDDLHPTQLKPRYVEFTDDKSVKFTFPGIERGAILEYYYKVERTGQFYGDFWNIQESIPKLYSKYVVEIPNIFFRHKLNWTFAGFNVQVDEPQIQKNIINQDSRKDASRLYYWERKNIPALRHQPNMPPYRDVAQYVSVDLKYDNWNELTKMYWKAISHCFNCEDAEIKSLAAEIVGDAKDDFTKIERIFHYTQRNFRYLAVDIGESGYIPHLPAEIIKNQYGDCKDMTTLNVVLLRALGIEAYPALINTKGRGSLYNRIISLDFNHMIAFVKDSEGNNYWLDATGSSCPLGEIYPSLEGAEALVLFKGGKSKFIKLPKSRYTDNQLERNVVLNINDDGSVRGKTELLLSGNENLSIRSYLKDATEKDMHEFIERYVNANLPDLAFDSLYYDNPAAIADTFKITFTFERDKIGSHTGHLLIFKPTIFAIESELDTYRDEERKYPIMFYAPSRVTDRVEINFNPEVMDIEALTKLFHERHDFASFFASTSKREAGRLIYSRAYAVKNTNIPEKKYPEFRNIHKAIAAANVENIILRFK